MYNIPLNRVGNTTLQIRRRTQGYFSNGDYYNGDETTIDVIANVQPLLKQDEIIILPEADRTKAALKLFSRDELREKKEGIGGWECDQFMWEGDLYEIRKVVRYVMGVLNHYRAVAVRKELT